MTFSEQDEHGNERGVRITLREDVTPRQILDIAKYYKRIGWLPSRPTVKIIEKARKVK